MRSFRVVGSSFATGALLCVLMGCGGMPVAGVPATSEAALKGNWLVTPGLPIFGISQPQAEQFGLALTLDVVNDQVIATGSTYYPCGNAAVGGGTGLTPATIASDGSFTLQTKQLGSGIPTIAISLHGFVPRAGSDTWMGTYSATNANTGCTPVGGTFAAMPIQQVAGTFTGTGSIGPQSAGLPTAITVTAMLQQGGPASLDSGNSEMPVNSVNALSGSISVQGVPCFATGTASIPGGTVAGNSVNLQFAMDDGSRLLLIGTVTNLAASTIAVTSIAVLGGNCDQWAGFSSTLTRQ